MLNIPEAEAAGWIRFRSGDMTNMQTGSSWFRTYLHVVPKDVKSENGVPIRILLRDPENNEIEIH